MGMLGVEVIEVLMNHFVCELEVVRVLEGQVKVGASKL